MMTKAHDLAENAIENRAGLLKPIIGIYPGRKRPGNHGK